jgi:L-rhamnose isomerase/sugar isomerase
VKDPLEDLLQSVEAILISYAQALLVDRVKLRQAQQSNDVALAQEVLQNSFRTDLRPMVAESRLRLGAALDPLQLYRSGKFRQQLIKTRGSKAVSTGL